MFAWSPTLGGAIGAIYGGFVELDDAMGDHDKDGKTGKPALKGAGAKKPALKAADDDE